MPATAVSLPARIAHLTQSVSAAADRRPVVATAGLLLIAGIAITITCLLTGLPVPRIHDEFAYLLTGDTFASGRLTNPTPPLWRHFESFQIILHPTYQGKYPPAQGLFLALGMLLGHPIIGVWISVALMIVATVWALRSLLEFRWALLGGLFLTLEFATTGYWAQSYWGGAVAAASGALVFGAAARLHRGSARLTDGLLGGAGLALLANSRPLEGLVLSGALAVWLLVSRRRHPRRRPRRSAGVTAVALLVGGAGIVATGVYNHAVTGSATTFPHTVHEKTYMVAPALLLLPAPTRDPEYGSADVERFYRTWGRAHQEFLKTITVGKTLERALALLAALGPGCVLLPFFSRWPGRILVSADPSGL